MLAPTIRMHTFTSSSERGLNTSQSGKLTSHENKLWFGVGVVLFIISLCGDPGVYCKDNEVGLTSYHMLSKTNMENLLLERHRKEKRKPE